MEAFKDAFGFGTGESLNVRDGEFTEVTSQGYCERLGKACVGVGVGFVLFLAAFGILGWNEGRAVKTYRALEAGERSVVEISCTPKEASYIGKLVYVSCDLAGLTNLTAEAPFTEVVGEHQALYLQPLKEMYQYKENEQKTTTKRNGRTTTTTTYSYQLGWYEGRIPSENFHQKTTENTNPSTLPGPNFQRQESKEARLGDYKLSVDQRGRFTSSEQVVLQDQGDVYNRPSTVPVSSLTADNTKVVDAKYVSTAGTEAPRKGDTRVSWRKSSASSASVIAKMTSDYSFEKWASPSDEGYSVDLFSEGKKTKDELFTEAHEQNKTLTWVLRFLGFGAMWIGLQMVFGPLQMLPEVIPFIGQCIGNVVGCLLCVVSFLIAAFFSLLTIAIAWLVFRPVIGIPLLVGALAALALFIGIRCYKGKKEKKDKIKPDDSAAPNGANGGYYPSGPQQQQQPYAGGYPGQQQMYGAPPHGGYGGAPPAGGYGAPPPEGYGGAPPAGGYGAPQGYGAYSNGGPPAYGNDNQGGYGGGGYNPNFPPNQGGYNPNAPYGS